MRSAVVIRPEASRSSSIVPPAVWTCEASFHARWPARGAIRPTRPILPAMRRLLALVLLATLFAACGSQPAAGSDRPVRILTGAPTSLDPAVQGDAGSAAITAQLFESLTTFDLDLQVRPALAESWRFDDGGRQVTFHLRPGLTFSDGTPLRAVGRRAGAGSGSSIRRIRRRWRRSRSTSRAPRTTFAGARPIPPRSRCDADDRGRRPDRRPGPAGHRLRQHRVRPDASRSCRRASAPTRPRSCPAPGSWPAAATS